MNKWANEWSRRRKRWIKTKTEAGKGAKDERVILIKAVHRRR